MPLSNSPEAGEEVKTRPADESASEDTEGTRPVAKPGKDAAKKESNEERNAETPGVNTEGVNSPDPKVGEIVPKDVVEPGQVVDPRTGEVLDAAGNPNLSTPQPNPPKPEERNLDQAKGKDWVGNHTV